MAYSTITKSSTYMNTKLYTGTGSSNAITGVGHQPDLTWIKQRNETRNHAWFDAVRGATKLISSSSNGNESTQSNGLTAFGADGFTVVSHDDVNKNSGTYVSFNWKANGAGSANTDGDINTIATSVNSTAKFSISRYVGTGNNGDKFGHGLGVTPDVVLVKSTNDNTDWRMYHKDIPSANTRAIRLNNNDYWNTSAGYWSNTSPTSSLVCLGNDSTVNQNGNYYVAYCWKSVVGFSKFGSYTGNGNANGTFIYTGFKPKFLMVKNASASANWVIVDSERLGYNPNNSELFANTTDDEEANNQIDLLSNGFKMRANSTSINTSGSQYIYLAWGQSLVGSNNVANTAR